MPDANEAAIKTGIDYRRIPAMPCADFRATPNAGVAGLASGGVWTADAGTAGSNRLSAVDVAYNGFLDSGYASSFAIRNNEVVA
jgi:hypothetical protein